MLRSWVRMLWVDIIRKSRIADYFISIDKKIKDAKGWINSFASFCYISFFVL